MTVTLGSATRPGEAAELCGPLLGRYTACEREARELAGAFERGASVLGRAHSGQFGRPETAVEVLAAVAEVQAARGRFAAWLAGLAGLEADLAAVARTVAP